MIPVKNIYYMLSYAFSVLRHKGYQRIETEEFDNVKDLFSSIIITGLKLQIKRGLNKDYIDVNEITSTPHGKINITETMKSNLLLKQKVDCSYNEFSLNSELNQIIATTIDLLIKSDIKKEYKKELRKLCLYFKDVDRLNPKSINWNVRFDRNNQHYRMLIYICYLTIKGLLQTQASGRSMLSDFVDEQRMSHLYEKFILEYYRKHYPMVKANASKIDWMLDDGYSENLPEMKSDITLEYDNKTLIIDAKYYGKTMSSNFNKKTIHSGNLYQIFTYVKNKEFEYKYLNQIVSGMLLYAKTDEDVTPNNTYQMSGNEITVRTLDLNLDFELIKKELDKIIESKVFENGKI